MARSKRRGPGLAVCVLVMLWLVGSEVFNRIDAAQSTADSASYAAGDAATKADEIDQRLADLERSRHY